MKTVLCFSLLLFQSMTDIAQVCYDSLEIMFTNQYLHDRSPECDVIRRFGGFRTLSFNSMKEMYEGYFDGVSMYLVVFCDSLHHPHSPKYYPDLYAISRFDGKIISIIDDKSFCDFINASYRPISNLDKAYLYLALVQKIFQEGSFTLTPPNQYDPEIRTTSRFANDTNLGVFFNWPRLQLEAENYKRYKYVTVVSRSVLHPVADCRLSTNNEIIIDTHKPECRSPTGNKSRYKFIFGKSGNLISIVSTKRI